MNLEGCPCLVPNIYPQTTVLLVLACHVDGSVYNLDELCLGEHIA